VIPPQPFNFSTVDNRVGPSLGTTALCTMLRMGMRAQCAIINAGAIRGSRSYENDAYFTWADLKAELPFTTAMTACRMPGRVIEASLRHSRIGAVQFDPPIASGGYLHTCRNIQLSPCNDGTIESIEGKPFDPDKLYLTALPVQFFDGIDNHIPLLEWAEQQRTQRSHSRDFQEANDIDGMSSPLFTEESAIPAKMVMVQVFAASMWLQMGSFEEIDQNHDGIIRRDELRYRLLQVYGHDSVADLIVDNIFSVADMNNDGTITPLEMMICQFVATDMFAHVCTREELVTMKDVAAKVLGKDPSHDHVKLMVQRIRDTVDQEGDGKINRTEVMRALGSLQRSDLLQ
jgi:5'-nucleotidase, C-terminal domain/EF hand